MKRKLLRYLVIVSVCLIITGLVIARLSRRDDPSFNGRRLSASVYDLLEPNSPTYYVSSNAVAHLGLQAIPFLKRTVSKGETQFEKMARRFNLDRRMRCPAGKVSDIGLWLHSERAREYVQESDVKFAEHPTR